MKDCIFLVPDKNTEAVFAGFISRENFHLRMDVPNFTADVFNPSLGDTVIFSSAHELLRPFQKEYAHAVVVIDLDWGGAPSSTDIEVHIKRNLVNSGWHEDKCEVLVIEPELETWLWSERALFHLEETLFFKKKKIHSDLREWLRLQGLWPAETKKPPRPKEAIEAICMSTKIPRSSANYKKIVSNMSVKGCEDHTFLKLKSCLLKWFQ
jgi:hypothetical protein